MQRVLIGGQLVRIDDITGKVSADIEDAISATISGTVDTENVAGATGSASPVKRVPVAAASDAAAGNVLIGAVAGKSIRVLGVMLIAAGDVDAIFYTAPANTGVALSGVISIAEGAGFVCNPPAAFAAAWLATESGEALTLHLSAAVVVSGFLTYIEVDA